MPTVVLDGVFLKLQICDCFSVVFVHLQQMPEEIVFCTVELVELELVEFQEHTDEWAIVDFLDELFGIRIHPLDDVESYDVVCPDVHLFPLYSVLLDTVVVIPLDAQLFEVGSDLPLLHRICIKSSESL